MPRDPPLRWLGRFVLDVKLGLWMLRRSWGLTLVGGVAMTVVIGIGAAVFAVVDTSLWGTMSLDDGDRRRPSGLRAKAEALPHAPTG